jgi:hypothetical protein
MSGFFLFKCSRCILRVCLWAEKSDVNSRIASLRSTPLRLMQNKQRLLPIIIDGGFLGAITSGLATSFCLIYRVIARGVSCR